MGVTNSWQKFKCLTKNQKVGLWVMALGVCAVGVGAILNIRQNRRIRVEMEEMNQKSESASIPGR